MNTKTISMENLRGTLAGLLVCALSWQCVASDTPYREQLTSANTGFAFDLLQQLAAEEPGSNIFISPYSASTALQIVSTGAAGRTRAEMQDVLGTIGMAPAALNEANREIGGIINSRNTNFVLTAANAVWYREGTPIYSSFISGNERFFGAKVEGLNFNSPASVDIINAWAAQETRGKIDKIVSSPIGPMVRLFVDNAVYFLGNWQTPFDTNKTTNGIFQLSGGGQETLPMMVQTGSYTYSAGTNYQAVRLPYKGGDLAMYVFLPTPDSSVEELLAMMNGPSWQQTIQNDFAAQQGTVVLPRFSLNFAVDLKPPLEALGMETAFTIGADFSKISFEPLFVSAIHQQAVVEVNETGTEAAAVTSVTLTGLVVTVPPPQTFQMIVDRPFLFFIQDQEADTLLFMGAVLNP